MSHSAPAFQPQTLDVDERILNRNLLVMGGDGHQETEFSPVFKETPSKVTLVPDSDSLLPSVTVTPDPGFCVKTRNVSGKKVFINVCKVAEIPPAPHITEEKLRGMIASEDYDSDYRVPMSLGVPRKEKDKSGAPCLACDVAVNSSWFDDCLAGGDNLVFTTFVVNIAMEGLCDKYGDEVNLDRQGWTILKNKKYLGTAQKHTIQKRAKGNKIFELDEGGQKTVIKSKEKKEERSVLPVRVLEESSSSTSTPKYKLFKEPLHSPDPDRLTAEVFLPGVRSTRDFTLDVGGDRIVVEARKAGLLLDVFVDLDIDCEHDDCRAQFHRDTKVLTVTLPLVRATN